MYDRHGPAALDYMMCRYGTSKLLFRGPRRRLNSPHVLFMGGIEIFGKYAAHPLPMLVEDAIGLTCVNLGAANAGPELYLSDTTMQAMAARADATVVQIMGAQNLSNRYYVVHPRRNDRFLHPSTMMETVFRDVDFTQFHFTRHLLQALQNRSQDRFELVRAELQDAWLARMKALIEVTTGPVVLHWFADHPPGDDEDADNADLNRDPLFVTRSMLETLRPLVSKIVETVVTPEVRQRGIDRLDHTQIEAPAAGRLLGVEAHELASIDIARALAPLVQRNRM
ncbi:DUF6473 family protein [Pseudooceanicola sp. C21-150M6]